MKIAPRTIIIVTTAVMLTLAILASPASASGNGHYRESGAVYDYARVLSSEPIIRYVTVTTPVQDCWEDREYYTVEQRPRGTAGGTIFGAIVGGVIGHQFGGGRGNDAATALGTIVGAAIGNDAATRRAGGYRTSEHSRPVRRCETSYQSHEEERIDGYRVIYSYNGRKYATQTPFDPGSRIRIRVDVRPASW